MKRGSAGASPSLDPACGRKPGWPRHCLVGFAFAAIVAAAYYPWLKPFQQPQRGGPNLPFRAGDLTPLFSVWTEVTARSLFGRAEFPLWSDHIYCGEPFFAKPQIGVLSLTTLLATIAHFTGGLPPIEAAQVVATWTFLLHLWVAGMAAYLLCLEILRGDRQTIPSGEQAAVAGGTYWAAACGGTSFMLSGLLTEHTMMGHGPIVLAGCWSPLLLWATARAVQGDRPVRSAILVGVLGSVQLLAGGATMFLYTVVACVLLAIVWAVAEPIGKPHSQVRPEDPPLRLFHRLLRTLMVGAVAALVASGLAAIKILPGLELIPISNRAGGLALQEAALPIVEFQEPAVIRWAAGQPVDVRREVAQLFPLTLLLVGLGLVVGLSHRQRRWWAASSLMLLTAGVLIAHWAEAFGLLWRLVPMFHYQRIPQRALLLTYLGVSVLVALGASWIVHAGARFRDVEGPLRQSGRWRCWVGPCLVFALWLESRAALPQLPPTADIRREVQANAILNYLAQQPGRFRIHAIESTDRNWGFEHVTVPLGLQNLVGWEHLWLLEYLGAEGTERPDLVPFLRASYQARHHARFWGMMNVRFVTTMRPVEIPGLRIVQKFNVPEGQICQPAKSAGPYLYENTASLPRAWIVPGGVLVLGNPTERLAATYDLMDHPDFDPRRTVLLQVTGRPKADSAVDLAQYQAVAVPDRWVQGTVQAELEAHGGKLLSYTVDNRTVLWKDAGAAASALKQQRGSGDCGVADPVIENYRQNEIRLRLPPSSGYLVLSEKYAHFPGWRVRTADGAKRLRKANGVASALELDGTGQWVELSYWPRGFARGIWISVCSGGLTLLLVGWGDWAFRRARRSTRSDR